MTSVDIPEALSASQLGTKQYWDNIYDREKRNYAENAEDEGEIWFGEDSEDKIIEYLEDTFGTSTEASMLDLGTGNGHLLFRLREEGFTCSLHGIDYSSDAIDLARAIATARDMDVKFSAVDFLKDCTLQADVILDKGTFDAICLSDEVRDGKKLFEQYPAAVAKMMKRDSILLITSCNWTQEELIKWMTKDKVLQYESHIERPKFSFGGASGTVIATVAFRKCQ